jgi:hypothetical protein
MQFNNPPRKIKNNMPVQPLIKSMGRSPSRTSVVRLAVQRKKFSFPNTPMKTLGLIRIIGATAATAAAVLTLMFTATLGQAAGPPSIAWSPVTSPGTFD